MPRLVSIPEDRRGIQRWVTAAGMAFADAVLIHPPRLQHQGQRILVMKGSRFEKTEVKSCPRHAREIRRELMGAGKLEHRDWGLLLTEDAVFNCPSQAAVVVHGASKNGWQMWKLGSFRGPCLLEVATAEKADSGSVIYYEKPSGVYEIGPGRFV